MPNVKDQPRVKNVHLVKDAPKSRAGVTGYALRAAFRHCVIDRTLRYCQSVFLICANAFT